MNDWRLVTIQKRLPPVNLISKSMSHPQDLVEHKHRHVTFFHLKTSTNAASFFQPWLPAKTILTNSLRRIKKFLLIEWLVYHWKMKIQDGCKWSWNVEHVEGDWLMAIFQDLVVNWMAPYYPKMKIQDKMPVTLKIGHDHWLIILSMIMLRCTSI